MRDFMEPELVRIPAGPVSLGAPLCPPEFSWQHRWVGPRRVDVGAFQIARTPVTRQEYALFLKATGHERPVDWDNPLLQDPRQPVGSVSAEDVDTYCRWLAGKTGQAYRLPHADEWEKAARGGLEGKQFPWGDEDPHGRCCFGLSENEAARPVASFVPNGYGLYDMTGNVWEWLADLYVHVAADQPINASIGKPADLNRVLVGGSFLTGDTDGLWVAYRHEDPPDLRHRAVGFRLAI